METRAESGVPEPVPVANAVPHALFDDSRLEHYLVTSDPLESEIVMHKLFERVQHFNLGTAPPYSLDQLLEWFEDEGKIARGEKKRPRFD